MQFLNQTVHASDDLNTQAYTIIDASFAVAQQPASFNLNGWAE